MIIFLLKVIKNSVSNLSVHKRESYLNEVRAYSEDITVEVALLLYKFIIKDSKFNYNENIIE